MRNITTLASVPDIIAIRRLPDGCQVLVDADGSHFRIEYHRDAFARRWRLQLILAPLSMPQNPFIGKRRLA
jgi:hypothetical protein